MLELATTEDNLRPIDLPEPELAGLRRSPPRAQGRVTLRGEIVDSKCYLGAMKPGGGRTHRGCALLCLKGGIPPLFVSRTGGTSPSIYLLTSESRGPAHEQLLNLAGLPVVVECFAETLDDLAVLRVAQHDARIE